MDMYWAHVLEKEYHKQINLKIEITKKDTNIRDLLCGICGQNKYWCVCDTTDHTPEYTKFDCAVSLLAKEFLNNNAEKISKQEQTTFRDHSKTH
jgi:hypothetical protein